MNLLFMGTPDIAADALEALFTTGHTVCGVFTREDKPVGRKQVLTAPPAKLVALAHGVPVYQPKTLRDEAVQQQIATLKPDLIVVVAYGRILPPAVLAVPRCGCINLHVSLLPRWRGSAPIQWAVLSGDTRTGVSIMQLDEGVDTGPVLRTQPVEIGPEETAGEVFDKVSAIGAKTLLESIADIEAGRAVAVPQSTQGVALAPPLDKKMAKFTFAAPARQLHNLVRGLNPWPVAYFLCEEKKIKVMRCRVHPQQTSAAPGTVLSTNPLVVACGEEALELCDVVPEGSRPMEGAAWAAGRRLKVGDVLHG